MSSAGPSDERLRALLLEYLGRRRAGEEVDPAAFAAEHPDQAARLLPLLTAVAGLPLDRAEAHVGEMLGAFEGGDAPAPGAGGTMQLPGVPLAEELYDRRYRVIEILGEGGFGRVYKVEDTLNPGTQLALKEVLAEHQDTERFERRFRTEIQVQRNLSHPGIPQIFNDGKTAEGSFYYTMAFVEGTTLEDVLKQDAPLDPSRVVRLVRQILDVLEYAHGKGVVHRDLKPLNVVITDAGGEDERAHVLDFGIAKILDKESKIEHTMTMESAGPMGTPDYMSPEQVRGLDVDGSTDLYALGVIIYRMVTGELPFSGKTLMEVLTARLDREPPALDGKTVPPWLAQLVKGMLAREKEARPSTAQIQSQLADLAEGQKHLQRRQNVVLMVVAVAALLGLGWYLLLDGSDEGGGSPPHLTGGQVAVSATGIAITAPVEGAHVNTESVTIAGTSSGAEVVTIRASSAEGGKREVSAPVVDGAFEQELALEEGSWTLTVHESAESQGVLAETRVVIDRTKPVISPVGELPGVAGSDPDAPRLSAERRVQLTFQVTDSEPGSVSSVTRDDAILQADELGRYHLDLNLDASGEAEAVELVASDRAGNPSRFSTSLAFAGGPPSVSWKPAGAPAADGAVTLAARVDARHLAPGAARVVGLNEDDERSDEALWNSGEVVALGADGELELPSVVPVGVTRFALVAKDALGRFGKDVTEVERPPALLDREVDGTRVGDDGRVDLAAGTSRVTVSGRANAPLARVEIDGVAAETSAERFDFGIDLENDVTELELRYWHAGSELEGAPVQLTLARRQPTTPAGCTAVAGTEIDAAGRAVRVRHAGTGAELVLVPESRGELRTQPAYYIGRFELTRGQYGEEDDADLPIARVSIADARAFCARNGLRLPGVAEWLWAARGEAQNVFPWGGAWQSGKANLKGEQDGAPSAAPVDAFMEDVSWCGAVGLCGNVSEWCAGDVDAPITYRGGNFRSPAPDDSSGASLYLDEAGPRVGMLTESTPLDIIGFRVALDAQP